MATIAHRVMSVGSLMSLAGLVSTGPTEADFYRTRLMLSAVVWFDVNGGKRTHYVA